MIFHVYKRDIIVSKEKELYNQIRLEYKSYAKTGKNKFEEKLKEEATTFLDFHQKGYEIGAKIIFNYFNAVRDYFIKLGIYDFNLNEFISEYYNPYYEWRDCFDELDDIYIDTMKSKEEQEEYRRLRKENRSKWSGGGFGLSGAIKGATVAGALNVTSGLAHSVGNGIGNLISSIKINSNLNSVFKDEKTQNILKETIYNSIFNIHYSISFYLKKNNIKDISIITDEDEKRTRNILSNINSDLIDDDTRKSLCVECLEKNPYNEIIYLSALAYYGDSLNELTPIANFYGVNINLIKQEILNNEFENKVKESNSKDELIKIRIQMISKMKYLLLSEEDSQLLKNVDEKICKLDIEERTVEGEVIESLELANKLKNEIKEVDEILDNTDYSNLKDMIDSYNLILELNYDDKAIIRRIEQLSNKILYKSEREKIEEVIRSCGCTSYSEISKAIEEIRTLNLQTDVKDEYLKKLNYKKDDLLQNDSGCILGCVWSIIKLAFIILVMYLGIKYLFIMI